MSELLIVATSNWVRIHAEDAEALLGGSGPLLAGLRYADCDEQCPLSGLTRERTSRGSPNSVAIDPHVWSGRALQEVFVEVAVAVLHQCIRSLIGAGLLRTIMDISARAISLADRPQRAIRVTSVRMRREDRSSISSHPLADLGR